MEMSKPIYFVSSSEYKFKEAIDILPQLVHIQLDLPEEQSLDPQVVIKAKLDVARKHHDTPLLVEDTSLYLDGLNGFPGPLIKWMLQSVGPEGIHHLCEKIHERGAVAKTVVGYDDGNSIVFFEGAVEGQIVAPYGNEGFGWDRIFQPDGLNETFAEMGDELKPEFSMRSAALKQLREYLSQ